MEFTNNFNCSTYNDMQLKENGEYKNSESYTKAIAMYVAQSTNCFFLIKNRDTGIDPNSTENDIFKNMLLDTIKDNDNKLVIVNVL